VKQIAKAGRGSAREVMWEPKLRVIAHELVANWANAANRTVN
jgi:hypothetical protein